MDAPIPAIALATESAVGAFWFPCVKEFVIPADIKNFEPVKRSFTVCPVCQLPALAYFPLASQIG